MLAVRRSRLLLNYQRDNSNMEQINKSDEISSISVRLDKIEKSISNLMHVTILVGLFIALIIVMTNMFNN